MKPTLEQLQELSDHEINMIITGLVNCNGWEVKASNMGFYHGGVDGSAFYELSAIDYCNSWSAMGDLANKHKINAICNADGSLWNAFDDSGEADAWHENELRAKAIVFLLMDIK